MIRLLRPVLLLLATFISLAVLPANLDRWLAEYFPRMVDCGPLRPGEYQTRYVIADGREKLKCRAMVDEKH